MKNEMAFQIVPMTEAHVPAVLELWKKTEGLILTDTDNLTDLIPYFERNPEMSQVASCEDRIVGAVLCGHDGRRGYLHHLAVESDYRQQGIGRSLVDACVKRLRCAGILQCNLFVVAEHEQGKQFWEQNLWSEWPDIRLMSRAIREN